MDWKSIDGYFTEEEGEFAQSFCKDKIVLEIGSLFGKSTCCLADVAKEVHAIDLFNADYDGTNQEGPPEGIEYFLSNIEDRENIKYFVGNSKKIVPTLQDNFYDVVLVDGLHHEETVRADILNCYPKLKKDGIYMIHDYSDDPAKWGDVKKVTDELFNIPEVLPRVGILLVLNKNLFRGEI